MFTIQALNGNIFKFDTKSGETWILYATSWVKIPEAQAV